MRLSFALLSALICCGVAFVDDPPAPNPVKEPELRLELLRRVKADQDARSAMVAWMKKHDAVGGSTSDQEAEDSKLARAIKTIDDENTTRLRDVVARHGWPGAPLVGEDGSQAAWLLIQHADADPKFQRKCLDLMTALPKADVSQTNLAYLADRVLLSEGRKQVYGTQFAAVGGGWKPRPIEDEARVDERRAAIGLPPLAEYARQLEAIYGGPARP